MKIWGAILSMILTGVFLAAPVSARTSEHAQLEKEYPFCKKFLKSSAALQKKIAKPGHLAILIRDCRLLVRVGVRGIERMERGFSGGSSGGYEGGESDSSNTDPNENTPYSEGTHIGPGGVTSCSGGICVGPGGVTSCSGGTCVGPSGVTSCSGGTCVGPDGVTSCSGGTCIGPGGVTTN